MLAFSLLLLIAGGLLVYAGLSGSGLWKQPWQPLLMVMGTSSGRPSSSPSGGSGGAVTPSTGSSDGTVSA